MSEATSESDSPEIAIRRRLRQFAAWLLLGFVLPITLIWSGMLPFGWRYPLLVAVAALMALCVRKQNRPPWALGFRRDTLRDSLWVNGVVTLVFAAVLVGLRAAHLLRPPAVWNWGLFYPFYVLVSSSLQEFLFRSVLFAEMDAAGITRPGMQITISA